MSDISFLANSIWPNGIKVDADGHAVFYPLGTNKIEVPSEEEWPNGDTLVSPFVYEGGVLVGVVDTKAMTVSGNTTITLPYSHIEADFSSIVQGDLIVNAPNADYKNFIWAVVVGEGGEGGVEINFKYKGCKTVDDVKAKDADYLTTDIVDGVWTESLADLEYARIEGDYDYRSGLFWGCKNLTSFDADLSSLIDGSQMFHYCSNLTSFDADLSSLSNGYAMFAECAELTEFTTDLSSLTNGNGMFQYCNNLTTFTNNLSSLTNGQSMFNGCTNLTTFTSDLSSLTNGYEMFKGCKLDSASVQNIGDTINDVSNYQENTWGDKNIYLDINNSPPNREEMKGLSKMVSKGWTIFVNGRDETGNPYLDVASTMTLDENGQEVETPIPFYAKPVVCDEEHAKYVDTEGNYYNILGAQFIYGDDLSTYGMFTSEEDAAANMRLTKIEK